MPTPPLPPALLAFSLIVVLAAGVVRGFSGFGFSAVCVAGLSLVVSPARVVPAIFMLEVLASLGLLRGALRDIDRGWLASLCAGNALCVPLGMVLLAWLPESTLRMVIGGLLLLAAGLLRGGASPLPPTRGVRLAAGMVSGLINGVAAIGGMALVVILSMSSMPPARLRATLIALFLLVDIYALAWAGAMSASGASLLGADTLGWALWLAPAMLAGLWIGQRSFGTMSPERFRAWVLNVLMGISLLVVWRAVGEVTR